MLARMAISAMHLPVDADDAEGLLVDTLLTIATHPPTEPLRPPDA